MIKIQIKTLAGSLLFEYEKENNTLMDTVKEAVKNKKDLTGAYLRGYKVKLAAIFTGLYDYIVIPFVTEEGEHRVVMGCHNRSLKEWEENFWNNNN